MRALSRPKATAGSWPRKTSGPGAWKRNWPRSRRTRKRTGRPCARAPCGTARATSWTSSPAGREKEDRLDLLRKFLDLFLHLDVHLGQVIQQYGGLTYAILFAIVFCETGLVVTPILPGDSLLFAAGSFAALGSLK